MSRAIGGGDGPKKQRARPTQTDGDTGARGLRRQIAGGKPEPDNLIGTDPNDRRRGGRRNTLAVQREIVTHMRRVAELRNENPNAFVQAQHEFGVVPDEADAASENVTVKSLFSKWARIDYDRHMRETGHDRAVEILLRQGAEIHRINSELGGHPIFGKDVLEMACGTGTPILLLSQLLPPGEFSNMRITANDITGDMLVEARQKLRGMDHVRFTNLDICERPDFGSVFDTVVLSQTLPFVVDKTLLARENAQRIENSEQVQAKLDLVERIFNKYLVLNGYFVLIDEWPMKLTETTRDPMKELDRRMALGTESSEDILEEFRRKREIEEQFFKVFRPIRERYTLYSKVFRKNGFGARFVAELKARIDAHHSMYMMLYRKDPDKLFHRGRLLPWTQEGADAEGISLASAEDARRSAVERVLRLIRATDRHFIAHFRPINGEKQIWAELSPIDGTDTYDSRNGWLVEGDKYNTVILARMLHNVDPDSRKDAVNKAVAALKDGGSLIVIDEWGFDSGAVPHGISKTDWRDKVMVPHRDRLVFECSFREPICSGFDSGMYGYVFRKRY